MAESFSHRRRDNIKQRQRGVNKTTIISGLREGSKHEDNVARDQRAWGRQLMVWRLENRIRWEEVCIATFPLLLMMTEDSRRPRLTVCQGLC